MGVWQQILIGQAFNTVIVIAQTHKEAPQFRKALLKVFTVIWSSFSLDEDFRRVVNGGDL